MATQRTTIDDFNGISRLELEVKPFTVLIGPQSVGKSVTAKLLYFPIGSVIWELFSFMLDKFLEHRKYQLNQTHKEIRGSIL